MRARSLRPMFDRLDTRIVLDSGASMVCGGNIGASVLPIVTSGGGATQSDLISDVDWYLDGTPPPETPDVTAIQTPWDTLTN
jgi:hypothetical protein